MDTQTLIAQAYAAFNNRDIDRALALMTEDVSWPKASEGGRALGKQAIREYWTRQWADFDPHVEALQVIQKDTGRTEVKVHQLVKNLQGDVLADIELWHVYTLHGGLIQRMDILEPNVNPDSNPDGQSAAFAHHRPPTNA